MPSTGVPEGCSVAIDILGKVIVRVGFAHEGQGQYTIATQLLADFFGVEMADVQVVPQDSLSAPPHFGPGGSRLGVALAGAVLGAAEKLAQKLSVVAAHLLQTEAGKIEFRDGAFAIRGVPGAMLSLAQVAGTMLARSDLLPPGVEPSPEATYVWTAPGRTQPDELGRAKSYLTAANACHVVAIEIDRETGRVGILDYFIADDCGTRLNPATVEGMIQGGVAQGIGAALLEEYALRRVRAAPDLDADGLPAAHDPRRARDPQGRDRDSVAIHAARREGRGRGSHAHDASRDPVRDQRRARHRSA